MSVSKVNNISIVSLLCHCGVTLCVTKGVTIVPLRWNTLPASVSKVSDIAMVSLIESFLSLLSTVTLNFI